MPPKRSHLSAVAPDAKPDPPAPAKTLSLSEAVAAGDYLGILRAQRLDIVTSLPEERGPAKAALHRQLAIISKEIQALEEKAATQAREDGDGATVEDEAWDAEAL